MSSLNLDKFILIRSPAYSYKNFNEQFLRKALSGDFFRASIFFASQVFYHTLKKEGFNYDLLTEQARLTLWKYLNRMCYRPLPYGLFSSYSALNWKEEENAGLIFTGKGRLILRPDFKVVADYIRGLDPAGFSTLKYYTNNSLYPSGKGLRFVSQAYSPKQKFTVAELKSSAALHKLLKFISPGRSKSEIIGFLAKTYEDEEMVASYFDSLSKEQVVTSELAPNVTGTSYGDRCYQLIKDNPAADQYRLRSFGISIPGGTQSSLPALNTLITEYARLNEENACYTIYNREITGSLPAGCKPALLLLVRQMDKLTGLQDIGHMKNFKADFVHKYEMQEIALMEALDPATGIGYENLASAFEPQAEDYISDVRTLEEQPATTKWGAAEQMIFKKWKNLKNGQHKIIITAADLDGLPAIEQTLPPGFSVLFKLVDEQIWLDHITGLSGIELNARFSTEDHFVETALKEVCSHEMALNKEYVFAEIAFSANDRSSNINQRACFYPYEIPVLTHSTLEDEFVIRLDDLMVSVRDNQVWLRSKRLNKFILPRLSSAYNYQISTVPVFRFLCDLQFQGTKSNLSFSLPGMFPGLDHYPRVELGTAVISVETWVLNEGQIKEITTGTADFVKELALPNFFSLQEGDNFLVFNAASASDLSLFRKCLKNKRTATLTEYALAEKELLHHENKQPYSSQIAACIRNEVKSYPAPGSSLIAPQQKGPDIKRDFLPGQEWLYLKLYAHYSLSDEILMDVILPVVKKYKKVYPGFKWFFIRYQDPEQHLRLRFLTKPSLSLTLLSDLSKILQPWVESGNISNVVLDSYKREMEKYSALLINEAESFFYADSEYILSAFLAAKNRNNVFKLSFAINSSLRLIHYFIGGKSQNLNFLNTVLDNLSSEFDRSKDMVHKLDSKYRNFQKELVKADALAVLKKENKYYDQQLKEISTKIADWSQADQYNLLINLVHMHINRIFERNQREYEYVIYHFMKKHQAYLNYTANGVFE